MDKIFKALADRNRRKIISILSKGPISVNELLKEFSITQGTLSNHLGILKRSRLVESKGEGKRRIYSLNRELFEMFVLELEKFIGLNKTTIVDEIKPRR